MKVSKGDSPDAASAVSGDCRQEFTTELRTGLSSNRLQTGFGLVCRGRAFFRFTAGLGFALFQAELLGHHHWQVRVRPLAADKLQSNMDATINERSDKRSPQSEPSKHGVLGLIFLNYISDPFVEPRAKLFAGEGDICRALGEADLVNAALRDTLLPKLRSGELSLPAAMLVAQAGVAGAATTEGVRA